MKYVKKHTESQTAGPALAPLAEVAPDPPLGWPAYSELFPDAPVPGPNRACKPAADSITASPISQRGRRDWLTWKLQRGRATEAPQDGLQLTDTEGDQARTLFGVNYQVWKLSPRGKRIRGAGLWH